MWWEKEEHANRGLPGLPCIREEAHCPVERAAPAAAWSLARGTVSLRPTSGAGARGRLGLRGHALNVPRSWSVSCLSATPVTPGRALYSLRPLHSQNDFDPGMPALSFGSLPLRMKDGDGEWEHGALGTFFVETRNPLPPWCHSRTWPPRRGAGRRWGARSALIVNHLCDWPRSISKQKG